MPRSAHYLPPKEMNQALIARAWSQASLIQRLGHCSPSLEHNYAPLSSISTAQGADTGPVDQCMDTGTGTLNTVICTICTVCIKLLPSPPQTAYCRCELIQALVARSETKQSAACHMSQHVRLSRYAIILM